jgi:hypothetical protein
MQDAKITVDNTPYNNTNMTNGKICFATEDSNSTKDNDCNMLSHSHNHSHTVTVPKSIPIVKDIIGTFVKWSDGNNANSRNVNLTNNSIELYALYKTEYYLEVNPDPTNKSLFGGDITGGSDWYAANSEAHFWADPLPGLLNTFDRWGDDFSEDTTSGSIIMDGPKTITAIWKVDWAAVGAVIAVFAVAVSIFIGIHEFRHRTRDKTPEGQKNTDASSKLSITLTVDKQLLEKAKEKNVYTLKLCEEEVRENLAKKDEETDKKKE